jgi:hypothetical protein
MRVPTVAPTVSECHRVTERDRLLSEAGSALRAATRHLIVVPSRRAGGLAAGQAASRDCLKRAATSGTRANAVTTAPAA